MSAQPTARRPSTALRIAWLLRAASFAALFFFSPAALVGGLVAVAIGHSAGSSATRNIALLVVLLAIVSVIFGGFGGSVEGGLNDPAD